MSDEVTPAQERSADERDWLTVAEAARALGLSPHTLRTQIAAGTVAVTRIHGRMNIISREEVERYRTENLGAHGRKSPRWGRKSEGDAK